VTVHFEIDGKPISLLLDLVEVAMSHSGLNLAVAFTNILDEFGISDKVSTARTIIAFGHSFHIIPIDPQYLV
jgi:hypothetical protein